jgi:hypothetical protein
MHCGCTQGRAAATGALRADPPTTSPRRELWLQRPTIADFVTHYVTAV